MRDLNLDDLIESAREVDQPSAAHADQLLSRIMDGVGAPLPSTEAPPTEAPPPMPEMVTATTQAALGVGTTAKALLALAGATVATGGFVLATSESSSEPVSTASTSGQEVELREPDEPESERRAAPALPEPELAPEASDERSSGPSVRPRSSPERRGGAPDSKDTLAEELALVRSAKMALDAKNPNKALALLDEYARKFPTGTLKGEAGATRVLALCALQQKGAAESAAANLDENSPLGKRMKDGCKVSPKP